MWFVVTCPGWMADVGLESRNSSPRGLKRRPPPEPLPMRTLIESRDCWTTPRELSFPAGRQTRRQDTLPPRLFAELRPVTRS